MKRIFYIVILLALTPTLVHGFGLGKLDLNSALNEPFEARIQLLSPAADELDVLKINLADSEAFTRAKVDRPFILSKLKFALHRSADDIPDYIRVFTHDAIREPFLNFLIEVSWSNGRLFREYTVLLDPPLYDPNARASEFAQLAESKTPVSTPMEMETVTIDDPEHQVIYGDAYEKFANARPEDIPDPYYAPGVNYAGSDYGPTTGSDTLWSIASKMRPDRSVSVNKMMMALLAANPDAFIKQNINGLKRGQILRMPNESQINSLSNAQALAEAQSQSGAWGNVSSVSERPQVSSTSETILSAPYVEPEEVVYEEVGSELKLVAADDVAEATEQVSSVDSGSGEELVLAEETIQVLTQENMDLKDRVLEADDLLEDLKRLLLLKDDELAALQEQMAVAAVEAEMMAEEEFVDEKIVSEVEEEIIEDVTEEEELSEVEEAEEEMLEVEEEILEVVETASEESASTDIMGMVNQYVTSIKDFVLGNLTIALAALGTFIALIIGVVLLKFRKEPAETVHIDAMTKEAFPDFDSGDLGDAGTEESESVTELPDADADAEAEAAFMANDETPVEEEPEEEEEPLQEVNTYLAFEQFDQAEEFVRNVIKDDPNNPEYQIKLLEVFYTSGNKKSYEETAKILHDNVGGEGKHWNMALAMWQEMSPNRALFEAGGDDDDNLDNNTGGFVDVTADEEAGNDSATLDFDLGGETENKDGEILDITAVGADDEILDVTATADGENLLDVTAAVGLGDIIDSEAETANSATAINSGEDLFDLTVADVTSAANLDLDSEEDLLDVTAATSAGADSSSLLGLDDELDIDIGKETELESNGIEFDVAAEMDETVEFDLGTDESEVSVESTDDDDAIEFDMTSDDIAPSDDLEIDLADEDEISLDLDMELSDESDSDEGEISLELDMDSDESDSDEGEISLDLDLDMGGDDDAIELDLSIEEDASDEPAAAVPEIDFDLSLALDAAPEVSEEDDFDLDSTIELPESALPSSDEDDDDDEEDDFDLDSTIELPKSALPSSDEDEPAVFVPRAAQPEEQTAEDEIANKLDLAKAYVELGDKDSAKTILDETMAEGNDEQRRQAEDLLAQI